VNIAFLNARFSDGRMGSLRVCGRHIAALDTPPDSEDLLVDLKGDRLLPGLINAHDHLQLNSLPAVRAAAPYRHARQWVFDVDAQRRTDREFEAGVSVERDDRLLIGGLKNLLGGVTTVAHHDPLYPFLLQDYPISVVRDYGWSHSLYIDGEHKVRTSYESTPPQRPWMVHAAEGVDQEASDEFERLEALACIGRNTLLIHGVALDLSQRARLAHAGGGLIWCPSSNMRLFGKTAQTRDLIVRRRVALGTDSRLSGGRDLLDELRLAASLEGLNEETLESLVTAAGAELLKLSDRGSLRTGLRADLIVLPGGASLAAAERSQIRLVVVDGIARYGDADLATRAAPHSEWANVTVDGTAKVLDMGIAGRLARARAAEPGLSISAATWKAA
jgi:cytosine/adenosine deaminase-related metal-dependent hydrolase